MSTDLAVSDVQAGQSGRLNMRAIDWIWRIRGSLPLPPEQGADEAFRRLGPLFQVSGTRHERAGQTLTFQKKDQAAQDKMAVFDSGILRIEQCRNGLVLRYNMASRALLFCFFLPFFFLSMAAVTIAIASYEKSQAQAEAKAGDAAAAKKKKEEAEKAIRPLHPIDQALGAPAPEKPKKDKKEEDKGPSPNSAYVFAGIFAALYIVGRFLEAWLAKSLFRNRLEATTHQPT
jgi:hypothetical protein